MKTESIVETLMERSELVPSHDFPYRLEAKVGEGSMGVVYRAVEPALGRDVRFDKHVARLKAKLEATGFRVEEIDGHEPKQIKAALDKFCAQSGAPGQPMAIVAKTVKGYGVAATVKPEPLIFWQFLQWQL